MRNTKPPARGDRRQSRASFSPESTSSGRSSERPYRGKSGESASYGKPGPGKPAGKPSRPSSSRAESRPESRAESPRGESYRSAPARSPGRPERTARAESPSRGAPAEAMAGPTTGKHNLLYGLHTVAAAWINPARRVRGLYVTEGGLAALAPALARAAEDGLERPAPVVVEREALDRMLPAGSVHQGMALDTAPLEEVGVEDVCAAADSNPQALVVVLDQVTDPHNVGAILRSASAFGAMAVIVQDRHAPPVTGVLAKTASGAVDAVPLVRVTNLARALDDLQKAGFWCVGLDESGARPLHELDLSGRTALVMGSEGEGLRRLTMERCDEIARLPTGGPIGALNVSTAAAVALYEVARRR